MNEGVREERTLEWGHGVRFERVGSSAKLAEVRGRIKVFRISWLCTGVREAQVEVEKKQE